MENIAFLGNILCQKSLIDQETNNLSLIELIDELTIGLPKLPPTGETISFPGIRFELISFLHKKDVSQDSPLTLETKLLDPNGKLLNTVTEDFIFPKGNRKMRFRNRIAGLFLTTSGMYTFVTRAVYKKQEVGRVETPFHITLKSQHDVSKNKTA